jgi:diaminopimelate decarboxylase
LGIRYKDEQPPEPAEYVRALLDKLGDRNVEVLLEPGRAIAGNAGILVTRVEYLKATEEKNFAIVDAAMNDLIRPALYGAWQEIIPLKQDNAGGATLWDVVGPVCETGDFLGKQRAIDLTPGDLLAVRSSGAYGFTMSSNYNSRPRAAEVLVDGSQLHLIRARESLAQLWAGERVITD